MSNGLIGNSTDAFASGETTGTVSALVFKPHAGVGMIEVVVALLIFSVGMMSLLAAQLAGKKTGFEANQRSVATALARDILERMRANSDQILAYQVAGIGDEANRLPRPSADCDTSVCTAQELATFDIWQWESLLLGASEQDSAGYMGGLLAPRACITSDGNDVDVTISWRGVMTVESTVASDCSGDVDVESGSDEAPQRHQLTVSTFIAGR